MAADLQFTAGIDPSQLSAGLNKIKGGFTAAKREAQSFGTDLTKLSTYSKGFDALNVKAKALGVTLASVGKKLGDGVQKGVAMASKGLDRLAEKSISAAKNSAASFGGNVAAMASGAIIAKIKESKDTAEKERASSEVSAAKMVNTGNVLDPKTAQAEFQSVSTAYAVDVDKVGAAFSKASQSAPMGNLKEWGDIVQSAIRVQQIAGESAGDLNSATAAVAMLSKSFGIASNIAARFAKDLNLVAGMDFAQMTDMADKLTTRDISPDGILAFAEGMNVAGVKGEKFWPLLDKITASAGELKAMGIDTSADLPTQLEQLSQRANSNDPKIKELFSMPEANILGRMQGAPLNAMRASKGISTGANMQQAYQQSQTPSKQSADAWFVTEKRFGRGLDNIGALLSRPIKNAGRFWEKDTTRDASFAAGIGQTPFESFINESGEEDLRPKGTGIKIERMKNGERRAVTAPDRFGQTWNTDGSAQYLRQIAQQTR